MVVLPLQEHIVGKIVIIKDELLLNILERHHYYGKQYYSSDVDYVNLIE